MISVRMVLGFGTRTLYRDLTLVTCPRQGDCVEWHPDHSPLFVDEVVIGPDRVTVSSRRAVNSFADFSDYREQGWTPVHDDVACGRPTGGSEWKP